MNPRGVLAELRAAAFLRRHGYRVRHLRWRGGGGEIDLVAEENGMTAWYLRSVLDEEGNDHTVWQGTYA